MPISIPLTLRLVKGSKLTFAELDTNFVSLRNAIISVNNSDTFVTGGTYNSITTSLDFSGNTGFNPFSVDVSALLDDTNTFTTGATLNGTVLEFDRNDLSNAYNVDLSSLQFTGNTSGDCINDLYVSNIHSCSPLNINPLDEGNVYFGSTSGLTIDVTNSRLGIGTTTPTEKLDVSGNTKISGSLNIGTILSGTPLINLGIDFSGNIVSGITSNLLYSQTNNYTLGVPITINHNLNTTDVLVQIVDTNTSQLIYGSVDNYQLNSLDITLNTSLNNVKVLVIGSPISQVVPKGSIIYTLGHDSVSPTDNNIYFIGLNFNLTPSTTSNDGRRFITQKTGVVTQLEIMRTVTGTLGSSEVNTFYVNNVTQATQAFVTSSEIFNSTSSLTNYTLSSPLNVTDGDKLEIQWDTPAWLTNPTTVRHTFTMVIEY
jgi:hypothetical protein